MAYFKYFPLVGYDVYGDTNVSRFQNITNLLIRVRKKIEITNSALFQQYFVIDGDRPDTLAYQFYGDSTLHWLILHTNYLSNPYYDWPLTYYDLNKYVTKKYGEANINSIHHYEDSDGNIVEAPGTVLTTTNDIAGAAEAITNFMHEENLNDKKRPINIINKEHINIIIKEFKKLVR